jgi:hypothetical protein
MDALLGCSVASSINGRIHWSSSYTVCELPAASTDLHQLCLCVTVLCLHSAALRQHNPNLLAAGVRLSYLFQKSGALCTMAICVAVLGCMS